MLITSLRSARCESRQSLRDPDLRDREASRDTVMKESPSCGNRWQLRHAPHGGRDDVNMWNAKPYTQWAGVRIVEASGGRSRLELEVEDHHRGGAGTEGINGAIIAYLHDIIQGAAVRSAWDAAHLSMATISLNIQYLQVLKAKRRVVGTGRLLQRGGAVAYAESELLDEAGNVCSRSAGQFRLFRR